MIELDLTMQTSASLFFYWTGIDFKVQYDVKIRGGNYT